MTWADQYLARDAAVDAKRSLLVFFDTAGRAFQTAGEQAKAAGDFERAAGFFSAAAAAHQAYIDLLKTPDPPAPTLPGPSPYPVPAPPATDEQEDEEDDTEVVDATPPPASPSDETPGTPSPPDDEDSAVTPAPDGGDDPNTGRPRFAGVPTSSAIAFAQLFGLLPALPAPRSPDPGAPIDPNPESESGVVIDPGLFAMRPPPPGDGVTDPNPEGEAPLPPVVTGSSAVQPPGSGVTDPVPLAVLDGLDPPAVRRLVAALVDERSRLRALTERLSSRPG
jgi:hypothetical protein